MSPIMDPSAIAKNLSEQVATIWGAPLPFLGVVVVVWIIMRWFFSNKFETRLANAASNDESAKTTIERLEKQVADYKERLSGATPKEAQDKMAELERAIVALQPKQRVLTDEQRRCIADNIRGMPLGAEQLDLIYVQSSHESAQYAHDFQEAFAAGGWHVHPDTLITGQRIRGTGLVLAASASAEQNAVLDTLARALTAAGIEFMRETQDNREAARLYVDMAP